jgi:uncharacterized membrane protein YkvA (DUF1232 family)
MNNEDYTYYYSDQSFRNKIRRMAKAAGIKVVYVALLLYYMMKDPLVPLKAKITIMAALGYFILPADAIPDLLPVMGFSDDLSVLVLALTQIRSHLTPEIMEKARKQLLSLFGQFNKSELENLMGKI